MKAFVMREIGSVGFMDKPVPRPGPNDAIVQTTRALICTSDSHTGLMATAGARLRGAGLIIGVESVPRRQQLARARSSMTSSSH